MGILMDFFISTGLIFIDKRPRALSQPDTTKARGNHTGLSIEAALAGLNSEGPVQYHAASLLVNRASQGRATEEKNERQYTGRSLLEEKKHNLQSTASS